MNLCVLFINNLRLELASDACCLLAPPSVHLFSLSQDKDPNWDQTEGFDSAKLEIDPGSLLQLPRQTDQCWTWTSPGFKVSENTDHHIFSRKMKVGTFSSGFALSAWGWKKKKEEKEKVLC